MHGSDELTSIALVAVVATLCGMAMVRLRQPAIIGYIMAGILLGPSGFAMVENRDAIALLAELGVILLLFFIGMELNLNRFREIWKLALVTTLGQIIFSLGLVYILGQWFDWSTDMVLLLGFCLSLSSTAVAVKVLEDAGQLESHVGRIAVGVLIAQDLAVAPMLVLVGGLSAATSHKDSVIDIHGVIDASGIDVATIGSGFNLALFLELGLSMVLLSGLILFLTRQKKINLPLHHLMLAKSDLASLASLTWCFAFATFAGLLGLSPAFGAFLAGLIVGNSGQRHVVHAHASSVQAVLMMVFFLSIGLLLEPVFLWENMGLLCMLWFFVLVFKLLLNSLLLRLQGQTWVHAISASLVIGQLGEFSFVLAATALSAGIVSDELHKLIVSLSVLSLVTSPVFVNLFQRLQHRATHRITRLSQLFRFAYFDEWRVIRRLSNFVLRLLFKKAGRDMDESFSARISKIRRWKKKKRTPFDKKAASNRASDIKNPEDTRKKIPDA